MGIYEKIHTLAKRGPLTLPFLRLTKTMPLGLFGFLLGIAFSVMRGKTKSLRLYFQWLILSTVLISSLLLFSSFHPDWYFFPLYFLWQTFMPLLLFILLEGKEEKLFGFLPRTSLPLFLTLFLLLGQFSVFLYPAHEILN